MVRFNADDVLDRLRNTVQKLNVQGVNANIAQRNPAAGPLSLREISRRSNTPLTTLRRFIAGESTPRPKTVARLETGLSSRAFMVEDLTQRTRSVYSPGFSEDSLGSIVFNPGESAYRLVSDDPEIASPGREFGSTPWIDIGEGSPLEAGREMMPGGLGTITRVVIDRG